MDGKHNLEKYKNNTQPQKLYKNSTQPQKPIKIADIVALIHVSGCRISPSPGKGDLLDNRPFCFPWHEEQLMRWSMTPRLHLSATPHEACVPIFRSLTPHMYWARGPADALECDSVTPCESC